MSRALLSYLPLEWQRKVLRLLPECVARQLLRLLLKLPLPSRWRNRLLLELLKL